MRKHADWMAQPDDRILELLREDGPLKDWSIRQRLSESGVDLGYPATYLNERFDRLCAYGLIEETENGRYRVTERGTSYLEGRLDAGTLDREPRADDPDQKEFIV